MTTTTSSSTTTSSGMSSGGSAEQAKQAASVAGDEAKNVASDVRQQARGLVDETRTQVEDQSRVQDNGKPVISLKFKFTPEQVKSGVADAKANVAKLKMIKDLVPLFGFIIGIPALLIGIFLALRGRRGENEA